MKSGERRRFAQQRRPRLALCDDEARRSSALRGEKGPKSEPDAAKHALSAPLERAQGVVEEYSSAHARQATTRRLELVVADEILEALGAAQEARHPVFDHHDGRARERK